MNQIIDYILNYMVVGIIVSLTFEFIPKKEDRITFTPGQRLYLIFSWPFSLFVFVYEFIRIMIYVNDDE